MMPNYEIAELCHRCFKLPILRAALRSSGILRLYSAKLLPKPHCGRVLYA